MAGPERLLKPDEILRVMDAAQVIHERQSKLEEHEALDRDATIREIQVMYEELGDLVDARVIGRALDEHLAQRHAFTPPPPGLRRALALLYIRRGLVAKRVLAPAAAIGVFAWAGFAGAGVMRERAFERDVEGLRAEIARIEAEIDSDLGDITALRAGGIPADLPSEDFDAVVAGLATAESGLAELAAALAPIAEEAADDGIDRAGLATLREQFDAVDDALLFARSDLIGADYLVDRHTRLGTLRTEIAGLHAGIMAEAVEELARDRAGALRRDADTHLAARDLEGLETTAAGLRELRAQVALEYGIVIVGGVWRRHNELEGVRNYYLRVQAIDADGQRVPITVRNEEDGTTAQVLEWAERVPQEVYDRVAADRQDNGIIDNNEFGTKRRGFVTAERRHADLGQITRW